MQAEDEIPVVPPGGWQLEDFPVITMTPVAYTTHAGLWADPSMAVSPQGWMTVDVGGIRLGFPSRDEWEKFVNMGTRMFNSHQLQQQQEAFEKMKAAEESMAPPPPPET